MTLTKKEVEQIINEILAREKLDSMTMGNVLAYQKTNIEAIHTINETLKLHIERIKALEARVKQLENFHP